VTRGRLRRLGGLVLLGLLPSVVGAAAYRLDRDRPLWRHPGLWGPTAARAATGSPVAAAPVSVPPASLRRLVLAFHYPWYGTPEGPARRWRHWNHPRLAMPDSRILGFHDPRRALSPGRLDVGATDYPVEGPYDSADPAVIARQLDAAGRAGLDGLIVSWWGRGSPEAQVFDRLLSAAVTSGLRLAPYYETGELWPRGAEGVAADLLDLLGPRAASPAWLRVDGRPVVFLYAAHRLRPEGWDLVVRRLHAADRRPFLVPDSPGPDWLAQSPGWLTRFDGLHLYSPIPLLSRGADLATALRARAVAARAAGRPFMAPVAPGFDDRTIREPGTLVSRDGGATYDRTWRAALAVDPAWILVASWNEWHEGSEIEPSREHGSRYLEATRAWAERFRAGSPP
jgi:glycoprotein endo-alpha-1,2-mannosidase